MDGGVLLSQIIIFGIPITLGLYGACFSIFEIVDSSRPKIIQKIANFCDFCHISRGRIYRFYQFSEFGRPMLPTPYAFNL